MKKIRNSLGVAAFVAAVLAPLQANAWTVMATGTLFNGASDGLGLFGPADSSLVGDTYTETITTNPYLNSIVDCATTSCLETRGDASDPGSVAAPFTVTVTVNGISFMDTESAPSLNIATLLDAVSINDPSSPLPYDGVFQTVGSGNCDPGSTSMCLSTGIQAFSQTTPFVPGLDFNQHITVAGGLGDFQTSSYTDFQLLAGSGSETDFYGTIDKLSVNPVAVPEPGTLVLMAAGLASLCLVRRKHAKAVAHRRRGGQLPPR